MDTHTNELRLEAPAKINLILRVHQRRDDGYHELETWMQKVSLCDRVVLRIKNCPGIKLSCSDAGIPAGEDNLVWKAAEMFFSKSCNGAGYGVSIVLDKSIPVAAGLGGGSSDAGTVLKGLNSYFDQEFGEGELIDMARTLGADVPFFVTDMNGVLATGIGEKMLAVPAIPDCTIVLVNPGVNVSTAWVFEKFALTRTDKNFKLTGSRELSPQNLHLTAIENDLEAVTVNHYPVIAEIKDELKSRGAREVLMSGSGPTVFGIFDIAYENREIELQGTIITLRQKFGEKVFVVKPNGGV